mmetsp:Transcript_7423/g.20078  ORF Transcript_7423/g.20078 Transcript_7423/m.20078 type:complete len:81 (-) Transcript_7423:183-425(-)
MVERLIVWIGWIASCLVSHHLATAVAVPLMRPLDAQSVISKMNGWTEWQALNATTIAERECEFMHAALSRVKTDHLPMPR